MSMKQEYCFWDASWKSVQNCTDDELNEHQQHKSTRYCMAMRRISLDTVGFHILLYVR